MVGSKGDNDKKAAQRVKDFAYEKTPEKFKNASDFQIRLRTGTVYVLIGHLGVGAQHVEELGRADTRRGR